MFGRDKVKRIEVISEIANAHQGKPELALKLARKSAEAGSNPAVKSWNTE